MHDSATSIHTFIFDYHLYLQFVFFFFVAIPASGHQGVVESGTRRKVKRQLSFQRYCHASRLLRGLVPHTPDSLHLLDDNYLGQAAVRKLSHTHTHTSVFFSVFSVRALSLTYRSTSFVMTANALQSGHMELRHLPL